MALRNLEIAMVQMLGLMIISIPLPIAQSIGH